MMSSRIALGDRCGRLELRVIARGGSGNAVGENVLAPTRPGGRPRAGMARGWRAHEDPGRMEPVACALGSYG